MSGKGQERLNPAGNGPAARDLWIGLDVGGTKIQGVGVDAQGVVRGRVLVPTDATTGQAAVESIARAVRAVLADAQAGPDSLAAIGVGVPGKVQDGTVSLAVNLKLSSFPLAEWLSAAFSVPVAVENDVRAAALGAYEWVQEQGGALDHPVRNMIYISIGTGISAGVILNGELHRGVNGMAGEVGHWVIDPEGELCRCGNRGCLETVAAGWGIARQAELALAEARKAGRLSLLCAAGPLNARTVCQAAACGDPLAQQIVNNAGRWIGRAIYNLLMSYGVDLLAVGGGVAQAGMVFFSPVWQELERMSAESPLVRAMLLGENKVILLPPEAAPAERGVIALARQAVGWRL